VWPLRHLTNVVYELTHTHTHTRVTHAVHARTQILLYTHTHTLLHNPLVTRSRFEPFEQTHTHTIPSPCHKFNELSCRRELTSTGAGGMDLSPKTHVLLRTFPNKNHQTDTLLKLISATHVIYYYYVVWYILPLRCGIIITTWSAQTTGVFFL
jgi:hypothetical protein